MKTFEKFTLEHKGYQALYAETLMSFQEFTEMFPRELYDLVSINNEVLIEASILNSFLSGPEKVSRNT